MRGTAIASCHLGARGLRLSFPRLPSFAESNRFPEEFTMHEVIVRRFSSPWLRRRVYPLPREWSSSTSDTFTYRDDDDDDDDRWIAGDRELHFGRREDRCVQDRMDYPSSRPLYITSVTIWPPLSLIALIWHERNKKKKKEKKLRNHDKGGSRRRGTESRFRTALTG